MFEDGGSWSAEGDSPTAVSLYSGAGGMDLGFVQAGFRVLWAIDSDPIAVETYAENLGTHVVCGDVLETAPPAGLRPDVVIGGPPCQGFSVIGRMDPGDPRSRHVDHFFDVVEILQPRGFVMENVKALAVSPRWAGTRERLIRRATDLGFAWAMFVLDAADYGVPQSRERMFLVGVQGFRPEVPLATSPDRRRTVREALAVLPRFGDPGNDSICRARVVPARAPIMRPTPFRGSLLFNGSGRPLNLDAPAKTLPASMGGNATPIVDQKQLDEGGESWVVEYHRHLLGGGEPVAEVPAWLRRLTVEEAAALQTFPLHWRFRGSRVAQFRQIGNAVPPTLSRAVAESMREALLQALDHGPEDRLALAAE